MLAAHTWALSGKLQGGVIASADMRRLSLLRFSGGTRWRRAIACGVAMSALTSASGVPVLASMRGFGATASLCSAFKGCSHQTQGRHLLHS